MRRDFFILQYKLLRVPLILSVLDFVLLMFIGSKALPFAAVGGWIWYLWAADNLMGKSLVGDNAVMMHLLPASAKIQVASKVLLLGVWAGVLCSIPSFLMMRNGGQYIDEAVMGIENGFGGGASLFYRGLPKFRYAIETCPSAMDTAVGDLVDGGAGIVQIAVMAAMIPVILFVIGCFFAAVVLIAQLYLHPLLKKLPTLVVSIIGMGLATAVSAGIAAGLSSLTVFESFGLFALELLLFLLFGGCAFLLGRCAVKRLEKGYDV